MIKIKLKKAKFVLTQFHYILGIAFLFAFILKLLKNLLFKVIKKVLSSVFF
jgi:hypothetical protein